MKLFAVDIDGTYLPFSYAEEDLFKPAGENVDALRSVLKQGHIVVFASGRSFLGVLPFVEQLGYSSQIFVITSYGASLYRSDGTLIYSHTIDRDMVFALQKAFKDEDNTYLCYLLNHQLGYVGKGNFAKEESAFTRMPLRNLDKEPFQNGEAIEKALLTSHLHQAETMEIPPVLLKEAKAMATNDFFLEFVSKEASKAEMIRRLASRLDIKEDDIIAFGDSYNDLSMVKSFYGIAPSDGKEVVKAAAKMVSCSSKEGAVAYALKKLGYF